MLNMMKDGDNDDGLELNINDLPYDILLKVNKIVW